MIMNLNLSYNSVSFKEHQLDQCFNSEDFLETFCEYLERTKSLNHIDLSGLSFERAQLKMLCPRLVSIKTLIGIHLSDMGIKRNLADPENDIML
jgi:Ran GTPase-activating protein (RanGAP) involved in mRNA processing and transport